VRLDPALRDQAIQPAQRRRWADPLESSAPLEFGARESLRRGGTERAEERGERFCLCGVWRPGKHRQTL